MNCNSSYHDFLTTTTTCHFTALFQGTAEWDSVLTKERLTDFYELDILPATQLIMSKHYRNKKDGYRQQNVRQRQKLISIIDYDVCMTFY